MNEALNSGYTLLKGRTNVFAEFVLIALAYNMKRFVVGFDQLKNFP